MSSARDIEGVEACTDKLPSKQLNLVLNASLSPPLFLDGGSELVSSVLIPNSPWSKALSQNLEREDGNEASHILEETISLQGKSNDVISPLEQDHENGANGNYSSTLQSMHQRTPKVASHIVRDQAAQKTGTKKLHKWPGANYVKKYSMDIDDHVSKKKQRVDTAMGSKRGVSARLTSQSDDSDSCKKEAMAKNVISERHRRHKLNDKLYSLRALVPHISKMDKASVVTDAINYVKELRTHVEEVETEIAQLSATKEALANGLPLSKLDFTCGRPAYQHHHEVVKFSLIRLQGQMYRLQVDCTRSIGSCLDLSKAIQALRYDTISANLSIMKTHSLNNLIIQRFQKSKCCHKKTFNTK